MNLEFWILDGIQTLRTPAGDVLMPFITSFGKRRCNMDCTYSYFAPDPENAKNRSDPGSSIDSGRDTLQSASEKSDEKDPPLRYQGCRQAFDSVSVGLFLSFGTYCSVLCRCIGALFCRGKVPVEGSTGFGSFHCIFQNVFVCTLSNGYSGWSASGNPVRISRMPDRAENRTI